MVSKKYNVVSLFSGAMGLDLGLESTGRFRILACVEKERSFCDTIRANQSAGRLDKNLKIFEGDIAEIDPAIVLKHINKKPGEIDLLVGGPPCQSFSTAGRRGTTQDPRGTLLWQYLRFIDHLRPKFFLMENVRGLLSAALKHRPIAQRPDKDGPPLNDDEMPGSVVRLFADELQAIEGDQYHMDCFEVNSVNYGAPQIRERALFIGNRFNAEIDFPQPTHGAPHTIESPRTLFNELPQQIQAWATLKDAIGNLDESDPVIMDFSPRKKRFLALVPQGSNWRSLPINIQKESMGKAWYAKGGRSGWWRRLNFDLPSPTLVTMPNHASTALCHPVETRALTVCEYARIQEFPKDWEVKGTPAEQYAQIGNAVPTRLGKEAGEVIAYALDQLRARDNQPYQKGPSTYRIVYVQSHIRTRQWFKNGKVYLWEDGSTAGDATYAAPKTRRKISSIRK